MRHLNVASRFLTTAAVLTLFATACSSADRMVGSQTGGDGGAEAGGTGGSSSGGDSSSGAPSGGAASTGCEYEGEFYPNGSSFTTDRPCSYCECNDGELDCITADCSPVGGSGGVIEVGGGAGGTTAGGTSVGGTSAGGLAGTSAGGISAGGTSAGGLAGASAGGISAGGTSAGGTSAGGLAGTSAGGIGVGGDAGSDGGSGGYETGGTEGGGTGGGSSECPPTSGAGGSVPLPDMPGAYPCPTEEVGATCMDETDICMCISLGSDSAGWNCVDVVEGCPLAPLDDGAECADLVGLECPVLEEQGPTICTCTPAEIWDCEASPECPDEVATGEACPVVKQICFGVAGEACVCADPGEWDCAGGGGAGGAGGSSGAPSGGVGGT